ncbi:MAG: polysaccharide deacetylase family protein, partial [Armatimonadetes bacterium]|nr:polysaccharide deacetylase family protein [Armatimonadota bacterium]
MLAEMGICATVYVVAGAVGKTNAWDERIGDRTETILDADDVRELSAAGFEIGSHGMTHAHLTELSDAELKTEVAESKRVLEDFIGAPVTGFSYPYGEWDARVRDAVMEAGYEYAVGTG